MLSVMCEPAVGCVESVLVGRVGALYLAAIAPSSVMFWLIEEVVFALGISLTTMVSEASAARSLISLDELDDDDGETNAGIRFRSEDTRDCASVRLSRICIRRRVRARGTVYLRSGDAGIGVFDEAFKLGRLYTAIRVWFVFPVAVTLKSRVANEK